MEITTEEKTSGQEWQWCLVGNIVGKHKYGETDEIRYGNKQFRPNAKVYINLVYGGMGHESILVIGNPRPSKPPPKPLFTRGFDLLSPHSSPDF